MPINAGTKSIVGSSSFVIVVVVVVIAYFIYTVYAQLMTHTDYLISISQCEPEVIDINQFLCVLHPLFVTDATFRNNVIAKYDLTKLIKAIGYLYDGSWTNTPAPDGYLKFMVMNPWYISDEKNFTKDIVYYAADLTTFEYNGIPFSAFSGEDGLYLSKYIDPEVKITYWYLYIDFSILINIRTDIVKGDLVVKSANDVDTALMQRFYEFYRNNLRIGACENLLPKAQQTVAQKCLFFNPKTDKTPESFSGLIKVLRRIIVVALEDNLINDYISQIDKKISEHQTISRMQFFMWLAMKSQRDSVKYEFLPISQKTKF
jgi:hypothetical protein